MHLSDIEFLKSENLKLRNYISLISAEKQLKQRIEEIRQNFVNPDDFNRITMPIEDRINKIKSEKQILESDLNLIQPEC